MLVNKANCDDSYAELIFVIYAILQYYLSLISFLCHVFDSRFTLAISSFKRSHFQDVFNHLDSIIRILHLANSVY